MYYKKTLITLTIILGLLITATAKADYINIKGYTIGMTLKEFQSKTEYPTLNQFYKDDSCKESMLGGCYDIAIDTIGEHPFPFRATYDPHTKIITGIWITDHMTGNCFGHNASRESKSLEPWLEKHPYGIGWMQPSKGKEYWICDQFQSWEEGYFKFEQQDAEFIMEAFENKYPEAIKKDLRLVEYDDDRTAFMQDYIMGRKKEDKIITLTIGTKGGLFMLSIKSWKEYFKQKAESEAKRLEKLNDI